MFILTKRKIMKDEENCKTHFFDITFEWEDILSELLSASLKTRNNLIYKIDEFLRKLCDKVNIPIFSILSIINNKSKNIYFMFDMSTKKKDGIYNNKKYISCLIDYYLDNSQYQCFLKAYCRNLFVLVSSREVYEYLIERDCPIKIYHFPLSLPDYYFDMKTRYTKDYDLVLFARQNPLLIKYINRYESMHPDLKIIRRKYKNGHYIYYESNTGEFISYGDTREQYINLVRKSKIAFYSTPGMDNTRSDANGWNQVTPHFLEEVAGQCHIIARYPDNADTRWYELDSICKCINSYNEFEDLMDKYLDEFVDLDKYEKYLKKHITSQRAILLKEILKENNLL